jgi:hypothetical protein
MTKVKESQQSGLDREIQAHPDELEKLRYRLRMILLTIGPFRSTLDILLQFQALVSLLPAATRWFLGLFLLLRSRPTAAASLGTDRRWRFAAVDMDALDQPLHGGSNALDGSEAVNRSHFDRGGRVIFEID